MIQFKKIPELKIFWTGQMTNAFIFDLDGVLIDSKEIHFYALNLALSEIDSFYVISKEEQALTYEGLSTKAKLDILSYSKGLPKEFHNVIWEKKQIYSLGMFQVFDKDQELIDLFKLIKSFNIKIGVASNAIRDTVVGSLKSLGIYDFVDYALSNEDVSNPKPNPEIYKTMMSLLGSSSEKTIIFEDSEIGQAAAKASLAKLFPVTERKDISLSYISRAIELLVPDSFPNILVPMAGNGSRFFNAGYKDPKPLIDVDGKPMIQRVVENIRIPGNYIFIVQAEHYEKYDLENALTKLVPGCKIIQVDQVTDGAARTALLAKQHVDNQRPLIIANSDQLLDWESSDFVNQLLEVGSDGNMALFLANEDKWSYAKIKNNRIIEVAEKVIISNNASTGVYGWAKGSDFVKYAEQMIKKDIRVNNEFYICPVYNEAIEDNKRILPMFVDKMYGLGTPEDLDRYLKNKKCLDVISML
jgi:beta-phosphoglucomutase-like phosphatase (HAD superfamily)/dTDP-glucose pyrophosphorylase